MNDFTQDIDHMLQDIDALILHNEKLQCKTHTFSVKDWQAAYLLSILALAISSLLEKNTFRFNTISDCKVPFVLYLLLCGILKQFITNKPSRI